MEPLHLKKAILPGLRRYRWFIIGVTLLSGALGYLYGTKQIEQFTTFASVLIQPQRGDSAEVAESTGTGLELSSGALEAEVRLIHSPGFLTKLVDELDLRGHPEFIYDEDEDQGVLELVGNWLGFVDTAWGAIASYTNSDEPNIENTQQPQLDVQPGGEPVYNVKEDPALMTMMGQLSTEFREDAFLISIGYTSSDPYLAARIANHAAKLYVDWKLGEKLSGVQSASGQLEKRLSSLRLQLADAENEVERFRQTNNLLSAADGTPLVEQEIIAAKNDLSRAQANLSAEIRLYQMLFSYRDVGKRLEDLADQAQTDRIIQLRTEHADLQQSRAETGQNLGPNHPRMVSLNAEINEVEGKIKAERDRLVESQRAKVELSEERVESFKQDLDQLRQVSDREGQLQIQLREMQREASVIRELYQTMLARFQRTDQQRDAIKADARIVSNALVPEESSTTSPIGFALVGLVGSASLTTFLVLLRERFRIGFTKADDTEKELDLRLLSVIPVMDQKSNGRFWQTLVDNPSSLFGDALSKIYMSLGLGKHKEKATVIMVTSSIPSEGKTTLSSCFGTYAAAIKPTQRVLVIDLDFRRPGIKREYGEAKRDLGAYLLRGDIDIDQLPQRTPIKNLDYIPINAPIKDSTLLMSSDQVRFLIKSLKVDYDVIILDCPPILAVNDTKIAAEWADYCLFALKWSTTAQETVKSAIEELKKANAQIAGFVFTQAHMRRYNNYNYLEGGKYHEVYKKYYKS